MELLRTHTLVDYSTVVLSLKVLGVTPPQTVVEWTVVLILQPLTQVLNESKLYKVKIKHIMLKKTVASLGKSGGL